MIYTNMILHTNMAMCWFDIIGCDEHLFLRPIYPYIFDICLWIPGIYGPDIHVYLSTRYPCVSVDQIFMGVCRPDIYGCLVTRYLWVSVIFFFLSEGKAVGKFSIAILVLLNFLKSLLTIYNLFRSLGKPVSKLLIAILVLVFFLKSLFAIHNLFRPLGKPVSKCLIAIPVLVFFWSHFLRFMEFYDLHELQSTPIQSTSFAFPIHSTSNPL